MMARWQIIDTKDGKLKEQWDDGETTRPGEEGFSTAKVAKYAGKANFNYMGTPNWEPPVVAEPEE
jgi:hypothetical protein